ncbi:MAG: DEAD/DEAH box helicase family protein [Ruminococcus sp.]|nr:DEAD/DEAH box helicase family protein [Ruminococcus sp.]
MIDTAFERAAAFKNTYGNRQFVSRNIFARRLGSIEKELEEAIRKNAVSIVDVNELPLDQAKRLISEFLEHEYDSEADFSDMSNINIAYTSIVEIDNIALDDELELQVSVDLENYAINSYVNGDLVHSEKYDSIEAMLPALNNLDFNELTSTSDYEEEIKSILADKQATRAIDINEALADPIGSPEDKAEFQRELDSITGNTAESVTAAQSLPPLHIEKYGLTLDFNSISSLDIEWSSSEYLGGIDSDGHERKDNFTERYSNISFYDGGYPDMLIRYDGTAEYATGDYPVPATDAAAEIEEYLDKSIDDKNISVVIKDKNGSENYINAEKLLAANTVIDIPKYDISVNLREIDTFTIEDTAFLRNNERVNRALTIYLNADGTATSTVATEGSSDKPTMNFDLSDETEVKALKDLATDFIIKANNEDLNIYTLKDGFLINSFDMDNYGFVEEIGGNDENTRYRISENNDEQYKFNVQIFSKDSSGDYVYSGNGRFTETLDEAREYVRKDKAERSERESAEKSATTVKGENLNIGDKVLWEGDPYIIESKGGLLGMKPLFETNVSIISPSMIWQGMDFEVYEFAAPQQALASEFTEQEMLDIIGNYRYISTPKQDVVVHFNEHTDTDNRADYLRSIYNDDYSELIINDSRYGYKAQPDGLLLWKGSFLSSDEKQTISWDKVSELTAQLIDNEDFLGIDDIAETNDDMEQLSLFGDMSLDDEPTVQDTDELPVQTEAEPTVQVEAPAAKKPVGDKKDFVITNENLGEGGAKTKYRANVAAIRTLKEIEAENRLATASEQQILSQYVGWGGLKNAFEDFHDDWKNEYAELKELLTPKEYAAAAASVLNAHYTSPVVISAMYDALKENGFTGGRILEPAMGVGNFFGVMPTDIRDNSNLYGVELDSISGRIAQQLYQSANIKITGFEKTDIKNDTFDLAVGNVPFGGYSLNEAAYNRFHFQIHDHFFAKSLDKVKPNGIVAFITSKGTMDKNNPEIRKYIAERADLVGAIRLPNNAFKGNAGTEVTSDIIFLQKREYPIELTQDNMPSWIDLGKTEDGLAVNQYFIDNPQMVLGKIVEGNKLYGHRADDTMCIPIEGAVLKDQLVEAIKNIHFSVSSAETEKKDDIFNDDVVEIPQNIKNFSYAVIAEKLYYRNNNDFEAFEGKKTDIPRIKGMIEIRDCLREVISCQIDNGSDVQLQALQEKLNSLYDSFVEKYGHLNSKQNLSAFKEDSAAPLLSSLEKYKGEEFIGKADIFNKRTILAKTDVTSVETSAEALTLSLAKKAHVDMPYMQQLTGFTADKIMEDLKGVVFENPMKMDNSGNPHLEAADEYLSGNIRKKLEFMKENYADETRYSHNIEALEKAMPTRLQAADIDIKLGAPCVPKEFVQQFMYDSFGTPQYMREMSFNKRTCIRVDYSELTSRWSIPNKTNDKANTAANAKFGTKRKSAYEILEDCLNLQSTTVKDRVERDGKEVSVINQTETEFAQEKQRQLQESFKKWIYAEPDRREEVVDRYNRMFNSTRPREYDGSALEFPGMNNEIKLRKHQRDAVAHALYGGNTLFAHEVGAGKTYEMIAAAMEGKRLGLHNKALLCVPNHLTEQEGADFIKLYPNANILVATADDFSKKNRRRLFAKIATGDYDCVIIGHSQLINLPISKERQERLLQNQINDIIEGIASLKAEQGDNFQIKQMEKTRKSLETKLQKLTEAPVRDDVVNFEELGIDKLIIDEAHMFKNLFISTKMSNISGISTNDNVQKTMDLYLKTQYLDEITGGKGTIMATGTPVSNSISEIYTMMKYLQNDLLEETGLKHFDMWAANFAETVTESQLSPEGNSYQMKTRFAKFNNMPELMALFKECADIKTTDQLGLKIPECEMHTVVSKPSDFQKKYIEHLSERAKRIRLRQVSPTEDNMPMITNDGRKIGLDIRLMNPDLPDDENSKLNVCINNVYNIWDKTSEQKSTQVIFCDLGVPQSKSDEKKNGKKFSVYDDIKEKLILKGVPAEEIAFIHSAKTEEAKDKLFAKVRKGEIRVLIGSTQKMGAGTNIQDKLIASHDLDAPWKPSDMEQRRGRMVRQGNGNSKVDLYRYVTEGTFDAYLYQMLENKQKFISQIMTSKSPVRSCQDLDEVSLSYAEIKALSAGNPLIKEKMDLDIEVGKLKMLKASHMNSLYDLQDKVYKELPTKIKSYTELKADIEADIKEFSSRPVKLDDKGKPVFPSIELFGKVYTDKEEAGKALIDSCKAAVK